MAENAKEPFARLFKALEMAQAAVDEIRSVVEALDKEWAGPADDILAPKNGKHRVSKRGKDKKKRSPAAAAAQSAPGVHDQPAENDGAAAAVGPERSLPAKRTKLALSVHHLEKHLKNKKASAAADKKARQAIKTWVQDDEGSVGDAA